MDYTTKPVELPLSTEKEYVLVDESLTDDDFEYLGDISIIQKPFKPTEIDSCGDMWFYNSCIACIEGETNISSFREVIRNKQETTPQYAKLMRGGKWQFTGDKPLDDGDIVAVFNCANSEKPLPSDFFDEQEWSGEGLPPVGVECEYFHEPRKIWVKFIPLLITDRKSSPNKIPAIYGEWYHPNDCIWEPYLIDLLDSPKFRKPETEAERTRREMLDLIDKECEKFNVNIECSAAMRSVVDCLFYAGYRKDSHHE